MDVAILVARLILSMAFVLAAVAKMVDVEQWRTSVHQFHLRQWQQVALTKVLPILEMVVGVGLLIPFLWKLAVFGALALLIGFSVEIARLAQVKGRFDCRCFGNLWKTSSLRMTFARNGLLALIAATLIVAS